MLKTPGRLHLHLLPTGDVQMMFTPNGLDGTARPLLAKTIHDAESDLVSFFEFTSANAKKQIAELEETRHLNIEVSIETTKVSHLFNAA